MERKSVNCTVFGYGEESISGKLMMKHDAKQKRPRIAQFLAMAKDETVQAESTARAPIRSVSPTIDFSVENVFGKEMNHEFVSKF